MSSCLILQQHDRIFIGADTAASVNINGEFYRYNKSISKLFEIENTIVFCSGILSEVNKVIEHFKQNINNLYDISTFLKNLYFKKNDFYTIEILISKIENRISKVYQLSEYNDFNIIIHEVELGNIKVICGGLKTEECSNFAIEYINNNEYVNNVFQKTFDEMSCNEIGGIIEVYDVSIDGINKKYSNKINEKNIQFYKDIKEGDNFDKR